MFKILHIRLSLILFVLSLYGLQAQTNLKFDNRFVDSEDRWVAFQMDKDSAYNFGYIYIDEQAGLTFNFEGAFKISGNGEYIVYKSDKEGYKVRLEPNNVLVAFIPESLFDELKIQAVPDWLKAYKTDTASVKRLFRWGYLYNGYNECSKGLTYLERAKRLDPDYEGLDVELAFSYNCLGQFDKAITALQHVLQTNPTDAYINKEIIYAFVKSGQLDKAADKTWKALAICTDTTYNGENCYNLLHEYYTKKDKQNFDMWVKETKVWTKANAELTNSIKIMEGEMQK